MRLLVDSHVIVWWLTQPEWLAPEAVEALRDGTNEAYFSAASIWELGLKVARGKLKLPLNFVALLVADGFEPLSVSVAHAEGSIALPRLHTDPFDRLLVAQAIAEGLVFVTRDEILWRYPVVSLHT